MRTFKQSWFIIFGDFRGDKSKILFAAAFSLFFMGYLGGLTALILNDTLGGKDRDVLADFMLLTVVPVLGFTYSRRTMKYWSQDSYTKMLMYLKSLPIPMEVIVSKRKIQTFLSFGLNGILFFGLIYAIGEHIQANLNWTEYLSFAFTWIGYGLMIAGVYIYIEFLFSGKAYGWLTMLIMALSLATAVIIWLSGGNLFIFTIESSKEWGLLSPVMWGMLLVGLIALQVISKWTLHRLKRRNLI
ncbi:ABC-2 transporter permease [Paenibacillus sp. NPDC057934]|uniref:ABC-2 transporter permease n=1 Tax=Paenibacillus sp. NPDC057934 TaxID=3346282 RepID=UPI0036DAFB96